MDLARLIAEPPAARRFLPLPVPREVVDDACALTPSAPWRLVFAAGRARDRVKDTLLRVAHRGAMGIHLRGGAEHAAILRDYEFFGAPAIGLVCLQRDLEPADASGLGLYLATLSQALAARGLETCAQLSAARYPDVVRAELDLAPDLAILCGLAIGYPDPDFRSSKSPDGPEATAVVFIDR